MLFNLEWGVFCRRFIVDKDDYSPSLIDVVTNMKRTAKIPSDYPEDKPLLISLGRLYVIFCFSPTDDLNKKLVEEGTPFEEEVTLNFELPMEESFSENFLIKFNEKNARAFLNTNFENLPFKANPSKKNQTDYFRVKVSHQEDFISSISFPIEVTLTSD